MKVKRMIWEIEDEKGQTFLRTLEGREIEAWKSWQDELVKFGNDNKMSFRWSSLRWVDKTLDGRQKKVLDKLVKVENKEETQSK